VTRRATQITLRGLDQALSERVHQLADEGGLSLNQALLQLLRSGAGLDGKSKSKRIGHALDAFMGTWTQKEADALLQSIESCGAVDEAMWR